MGSNDGRDDGLQRELSLALAGGAGGAGGETRGSPGRVIEGVKISFVGTGFLYNQVGFTF